ncbi:type II DNA topoisomerase [Piedraia hortae CBS 480.64]|uniref:DNA topoisomerase 2 n=1 Tax=Piedraia hortae CBS 480.64 TaxID=1314780 RepID=A0A6A7CAK5_9PEZI|nr:type II DNA topoisomerase [Piedraia hortae CBS 480.64]
MDDSEDESVFELSGGSDFELAPKPKAKAPAKKAAAKPKATKPAASKATKQTISKMTKTQPKKRPVPETEEESEINAMNDDSLLSNSPPAVKRQKKAPAAKATKKPVADLDDDDDFAVDGAPDKAAKPTKKGTSSDQYQKLTQLEHILKRPDTYIGSVEKTTEQMWVFNSETNQMENRKVTFVPGLYKIFDEILVNAADNKQRDKNMDEMKVWVDRTNGVIAVRNNGRGIPIEVHSKEGIYIPEMIFGHLLTSSNYDDDEAKVTGGRNGYGAKLTNIYSTSFTLETVDSRSKQKYTQTWKNNMSDMGKAKIISCKGENDYTKITFSPDFKKFGMNEMDDDFEALVKRRVYDMAGTCKGVKVFLNGERIKIRNFKTYMEMYTKAIRTENLENDGKAPEQVILTDNPHERWEIGFAVSDGSFQQVSFVNSIATTHGGSHVNFIADQICEKLEEIVNKKNKGGVKLKKAQVRNHIFLFVNCLIVNPAFTSQTKEQLTTKPSAFGSKPQVSEKFLKDIAKTEAVTNILHFAQQKADKVLAKSDGNRRQRMNNSKLTDANKAGTKDGYKCTLILTEGDSASGLALAGRAVVDPDLFGVFPLRGKMLNVRDASIDQISKNQEIQNIKKFIGLQHKKEYTDTKSLRYGHIMIMTDQDHDGSHIKGLLINFLQVQFPSLLRIPGFLLEFITPIVKVWKGHQKNPKAQRDFFTMPEYEAWKAEPGHQKGWEHKYFKGLGTSDTKDARVYFADLDRHLKRFHRIQDGEPELLELAFSKKKADARKQWLADFVPGTYLDMSAAGDITYNDFINKELILFSMADNQRSIPSVLDGLKPGQRKVLYTAFRRNLRKDVKVVDLAGSVLGMTAYAYGDTSMQQTIIGLAQNFVGSNNMNYLEPSGNFGSRLQGGQDAASPRYIYTRLSPFARKIFHSSDEPLLTYNTDDGKTIEPEVYVPIVPMILINGADGIGTGWSTQIPNYKPEDVIENLKRRMDGDDKDSMVPMTPWFRGWTGRTEQTKETQFTFHGTVTITGENQVEITELPVRTWTQDFKDKLEDIIKAEKAPSFIKDYTEYNTPERVHFVVKIEEKYMSDSEDKIMELFKLSRPMATSNLVAFDAQGRIHKYATPLDILEEFYQTRLVLYQRRRRHMLDVLENELAKFTNQARFILMIIDNKLVVSKKKKDVLVAELDRLNFKRFPKVADARKNGELEEILDEDKNEEDVEEAESNAAANDFDYLLGMAIWSLTQERVEKLKKQISDKEEEIDILQKKSPKDLWKEDLDGLQAEWHAQLEEEAKLEKQSRSKGRRASMKLGIGAKSRKKVKAESDDSDDDYMTKKKKAAPAKPRGAAGLIAKLDGSGVRPAVNAVEQKPVVKPADEQKTLDTMFAKSAVAKPTADKKPEPRKRKPAPKRVVDDDDDDDIISIASKEAPAKKPAPRAARATVQKTKSYVDFDSDEEASDDGNDMLEDVGDLVKGIGKTGGDGPSRLFHTTSAQSSPRKPSVAAAGKKPITADSDISEDETDWAGLAQNSPKKATRHVVNLSDEDDELLATEIMPTPKKVKPAPAKAKAPAVALKPKKAPAPAPVKQSPAAKAYAKKLATTTTTQAKGGASKATGRGKKVLVSDDEDEEDEVEALANDLLSDDEDSPPKKTAARPARRAAAAKKSVYAVDDSVEISDDSEVSEDDFEDDDE